MLSVESTDDPPLGSFVFSTNGDTVAIGRDATKCGISLGAKCAGVSKVHIRLTLETEEPGAPFLRVDETNTYGTVFNGKRWKAPMVRAGDRFVVGKCGFEVKSLMDEDQTPPPEDLDAVEEGVEEEARAVKRRLEDEQEVVDTPKRRKGEDGEDGLIGSLWADEDRFSTHPAELAENRPSKAVPVADPPTKSKSKRAPQKKTMDIRHFLGESQKTVASTVSNRKVLAPDSVRGSQTQASTRTTRKQTRAIQLGDSDDDDFVESTPARNKIRANLLPISQQTAASRISNGKVLAPDSVRGSQTQRSTRSTNRQTGADNVNGDDYDDVVETAPQRNTPKENQAVDPEESLFGDGHQFRDIEQPDEGENEDVRSTRSTRILAPDSPPPRSVISMAESATTCAVPESVAPEDATGRVDVDGFAVPVLPSVKSSKRKTNKQTTSSKRIKLEEPDDVEVIAPRAADEEIKTEDGEAKPDLIMGLTEQQIVAIHEKSVCVMSLCRMLKNHASLSSPASATSSRSGQLNYKRFHKAAQGVYRHLSLEGRTPLGSDPAERTFVHVE
ncbi:hypothetical protein QR680_006830 [Steinernema hermaphroditum]|uniref:FHA domain-containing protein n=1 Tax=Steinernema hermaphroditum TaxID=289476 RepID=A0AA39LXQ4_9BILA|nr:hypothetical protein QR680_006830 [Steinernema hermaphroditum]